MPYLAKNITSSKAWPTASHKCLFIFTFISISKNAKIWIDHFLLPDCFAAIYLAFFWQKGICFSAAFSLNLRPQQGQGFKTSVSTWSSCCYSLDIYFALPSLIPTLRRLLSIFHLGISDLAFGFYATFLRVEEGGWLYPYPSSCLCWAESKAFLFDWNTLRQIF